METDIQSFEAKIKKLQKRLAIFYTTTLIGFVIVIFLILFRVTSKTENSKNDIIHAKGLVIEDDKGRNRIILGSPVPNPIEGQRSSSESGMIINDTAGFERFGLGLQSNGRFVLGLDAPVNKGDNTNRERITLVADENGSAYIRFLNRRTLAVGLLQLDDSDLFSLKFVQMDSNKIKIRQYAFKGEKTFEVKGN
jgi:hypothetical protein